MGVAEKPAGERWVMGMMEISQYDTVRERKC
jgi:hypothetical protein